MVRDNTVDHPRYTFPITISHKSDYNNESNKFYMNNLNKMSLSKNKFKFCYKISKKCIIASIILIRIVINAIEKRPFTNHSGGNSTFSPIFSVSCNVKDIKDKLLLCKRYQDMLSKKIDTTNCNKYYN